jgi:hypothetical protein
MKRERRKSECFLDAGGIPFQKQLKWQKIMPVEEDETPDTENRQRTASDRLPASTYSSGMVAIPNVSTGEVFECVHLCDQAGISLPSVM